MEESAKLHPRGWWTQPHRTPWGERVFSALGGKTDSAPRHSDPATIGMASYLGQRVGSCCQNAAAAQFNIRRQTLAKLLGTLPPRNGLPTGPLGLQASSTCPHVLGLFSAVFSMPAFSHEHSHNSKLAIHHPESSILLTQDRQLRSVAKEQFFIRSTASKTGSKTAASCLPFLPLQPTCHLSPSPRRISTLGGGRVVDNYAA